MRHTIALLSLVILTSAEGQPTTGVHGAEIEHTRPRRPRVAPLCPGPYCMQGPAAEGEGLGGTVLADAFQKVLANDKVLLVDRLWIEEHAQRLENIMKQVADPADVKKLLDLEEKANLSIGDRVTNRTRFIASMLETR